MQPPKARRKRIDRKYVPLLRVIVEVGFIVFLFYANLLMGEFTHSCRGQNNGFLWAVRDIFTRTNAIIALVAALIGHLVFSFMRNKL